ncbi:MAG: hypothetical protein ACK5Z5_02320 [Neisseriaceae bacterium]
MIIHINENDESEQNFKHVISEAEITVIDSETANDYINENAITDEKWCILNPSDRVQNGAYFMEGNCTLEEAIFRTLLVIPYDVIFKVVPNFTCINIDVDYNHINQYLLSFIDENGKFNKYNNTHGEIQIIFDKDGNINQLNVHYVYEILNSFNKIDPKMTNAKYNAFVNLDATEYLLLGLQKLIMSITNYFDPITNQNDYSSDMISLIRALTKCRKRIINILADISTIKINKGKVTEKRGSSLTSVDDDIESIGDTTQAQTLKMNNITKSVTVPNKYNILFIYQEICSDNYLVVLSEFRDDLVDNKIKGYLKGIKEWINVNLDPNNCVFTLNPTTKEIAKRILQDINSHPIPEETFMEIPEEVQNTLSKYFNIKHTIIKLDTFIEIRTTIENKIESFLKANQNNSGNSTLITNVQFIQWIITYFNFNELEVYPDKTETLTQGINLLVSINNKITNLNPVNGNGEYIFQSDDVNDDWISFKAAISNLAQYLATEINVKIPEEFQEFFQVGETITQLNYMDALSNCKQNLTNSKSTKTYKLNQLRRWITQNLHPSGLNKEFNRESVKEAMQSFNEIIELISEKDTTDIPGGRDFSVSHIQSAGVSSQTITTTITSVTPLEISDDIKFNESFLHNFFFGYEYFPITSAEFYNKHLCKISQKSDKFISIYKNYLEDPNYKTVCFNWLMSFHPNNYQIYFTSNELTELGNTFNKIIRKFEFDEQLSNHKSEEIQVICDIPENGYLAFQLNFNMNFKKVDSTNLITVLTNITEKIDKFLEGNQNTSDRSVNMTNFQLITWIIANFKFSDLVPHLSEKTLEEARDLIMKLITIESFKELASEHITTDYVNFILGWAPKER